ncbi:hypothetical protein [Streptomyces sp. NPDC059072]|uniref:hypothetical protein n=1 Tax=unclassified Streptomyces TaxID=2593676 RepID=UPI00369637EC
MSVPPPRIIVCSNCQARPGAGAVPTLAAHKGQLTVTWHATTCPHHLADRILAGKEA